MNQKTLRLAGLSVVVAVLVATVSLLDASAAGTPKPDGCPTGKTKVVDSYFTARNSADTGPDGHVWALDAGTRFIRIWSLGGDAYCMEIRDVGTFTTFAGLSPEGTATIGAGVTGSFDGTSYLRVYGKFAPTVPTEGTLGDVDAQCQQDGTCAGQLPSIRRSYFPAGYQHVDPGAFTITYASGACGTWTQTNSADTGDIVC